MVMLEHYESCLKPRKDRIVECSETERAILRTQFLAFIDRCVNIRHMGVRLQGTSRRP